MNKENFELSEAQMTFLNDEIRRIALNYRQSEGEPLDGWSVIFHFTPTERHVQLSVAGSNWIDISDSL